VEIQPHLNAKAGVAKHHDTVQTDVLSKPLKGLGESEKEWNLGLVDNHHPQLNSMSFFKAFRAL
jgi:hypothetical protein